MYIIIQSENNNIPTKVAILTRFDTEMMVTFNVIEGVVISKVVVSTCRPKFENTFNGVTWG